LRECSPSALRSSGAAIAPGDISIGTVVVGVGKVAVPPGEPWAAAAAVGTVPALEAMADD